MWKGADYVCFLCEGESSYFCQEWPPKVTVCPHCNEVVGLVAFDPKTERCTYTKLPRN